MKKKIILIAAITGAIFELMAIIYTVNMRGKAEFGGEYCILPLFIVIGYIVIEIINTVKQAKFIRFDRRTKHRKEVLKHEIFPEYDKEMLMYEIFCFRLMEIVTKRLCAYDEMNKEPTAPMKEDYTFDGWYTDSKLTQKYDFRTKITKSFTLYAKLTKSVTPEPTTEPIVMPTPNNVQNIRD